MIELVLTICSILEGDRRVPCKTERLTYMAEQVTPHQCMLYGQHEIAKWQEGHPNWRVQKWSCGQARIFGKA